MQSSVTELNSSSSLDPRYVRGVVSACFLTQLVTMGLALVTGYDRINRVYDQQLIDRCFWILPAIFVTGQIWFLVRAAQHKTPDSTPILKSYTAFSQRFWVACVTLLLVFSSLTSR
jgi:hypothetical protein